MWWHFIAKIHFDPHESVIVLDITLEGPEGRKKTDY